MSAKYYGVMWSWRERREENLSDTVYSGLYIEVSPQLRLLVAKLSHGYRILICDDLDKFVFNDEVGCQVPVPPELIDAVMSFATEDKDFQAGWSATLKRIQDQSNQHKSGV